MKSGKSIVFLYITTVSIVMLFNENVFAQTWNFKIPYPPRFDFNQQDSLEKDECSKIIKDTSNPLIVSYSYWEMGSAVAVNSEVYPNGFGIYILYLNNNKFYVKKIDNFGYYKKIQVDGKALKDIVDEHFEEMKHENPTRHEDTISVERDSNGRIKQVLTEIKVTVSPDDGPKNYLTAYRGSIKTYFEDPEDFASMKFYKDTYQYKLVLLMRDMRSKVDKKRKWRTATKFDPSS